MARVNDPGTKRGVPWGREPSPAVGQPAGSWRCRLAGLGHLPLKEEIAGSNPVTATTAPSSSGRGRLPFKEKITGSNPVGVTGPGDVRLDWRRGVGEFGVPAGLITLRSWVQIPPPLPRSVLVATYVQRGSWRRRHHTWRSLRRLWLGSKRLGFRSLRESGS